MKIDYKNLEKKIKVNFKNKELLIKSLTHKSFNKENNNEKVEFLGDRVLGLVMAKKLLEIYPNEKGYFGQFGGRYVSETLMPLILEVEKEYEKIKNDKDFISEFNHYLKTYIGRPSPLFFAERISNDLGGPKIYFKRDELNHTGAHKINNCMGQILLAKKMGKSRIIAETGAGQHGVAHGNCLCSIWLTLYSLYGRKRY